MIAPTVEDLAIDPAALALIHDEWQGLDDQDRCAFNDFVIGALVVDLTSEQVARAIRIAKSCMTNAAAEAGEPSDLDHDQLTDAAQDGWR